MISIVIARYVTPTKMLLVAVHSFLVVAIACAWFAVRYRLALWILTPLLGCFRDVLWPLGFAWADHYITLFGVIVGLQGMVVMLCNMGQSPLQGWLYDHTVIESIFYTTVGYAAVLCVLTCVMTYYASRRGSRKHRAKVKALHSESSVLKTGTP